MKPLWVSRAEQVRGLDRHLIEVLGIPGLALMELAADGLAQAIRRSLWQSAQSGVVVVCGGGNNGGDGYVLARRLQGWGVPVQVWSLRAESRGDAALARASCVRAGVPECEGLPSCGLIVDAVCGTGLKQAPKADIENALQAMQDHPAPILAVDLPSGLCADTGQTWGTCPQATRTVTFGRWKPGLLSEPGASLAGEVVVHDIGLELADPHGKHSAGRLVTPQEALEMLPERAADSHKGHHGHLLVVAGSTAMAGAAVLACTAGIRTGAGRVTLWTPQGALPRLEALPPEIMVQLVGAGDRLDPQQAPSTSDFDAVLAGPGLGGGQPLTAELQRWLLDLWGRFEGPVIFDADALICAKGAGAGPRVITPHPGEAGRLLGIRNTEVQANRFAIAHQLATQSVALLKGRHSLIATPDGELWVNGTGNPILATAGSGDVLAGMVAALAAQGLEPRSAAVAAAHLHGRCADHLASRGPGGWTSSDVAMLIPAAITELVQRA